MRIRRAAWSLAGATGTAHTHIGDSAENLLEMQAQREALLAWATAFCLVSLASLKNM